MFKKSNRGFTLIELLTVMGIMAVLGGVAMSNYFSYQSSVAVDGVANELLGNLRDAQQRAISQDDQAAWGVYVNALSSGNDYYGVFSGTSFSSGTLLSQVTLPSNIRFLIPSQGSTDEIVFAKSTGIPDKSHVFTVIYNNDINLARTIEVNSVSGLINLFSGLTSAPVVTSINPYLALNSEPVYITNLSGANFQSGSTFKLTKTGESDINCTGVSFVNSQKLTGTCDITGKTPGTWNVVVTNPDLQTAELANGFMISLAGGNTSGYAWSENIGWISFNCNDTGSCNQANYSVNVDANTGLFSGYAWSENIGWISFNDSDLTGCPSGTCEARLTGSVYPKTVTGWAKIISTGDWISLSSAVAPVYSVQLAADGKFSGYSWDSNTVGWLNWGDGVLYNVLVTW